MAIESEHPNQGIDGGPYNTAIHPRTKFEIFQLKEALNSITHGSRNTLLHLATSVGNLPFIQKFLQLNTLLVKATNSQGNTALHLATQGGFSKVVEILLQTQKCDVESSNKYNETTLFKACKSGDLPTVK